MNILIVNASCNQGGAARAAYRLHKALLTEGANTQMLVLENSCNDFTVIGPKTRKEKAIVIVQSILDQLLVKKYKNRTGTLFSPNYFSYSNIVSKINEINPDIVHLHWISAGMIKIEDLANIKAPIVWSLHDNWAFTGGCHIMWECERYRDACGQCPRLGSKRENDISRKIYRRKRKTYRKINNLTVVGLSRWLESCAKKSSLFKEHKIINIPNPINTQLYKLFDKEKARDLFNLPKNKKLILFGAMGATSDINKGFFELKETLKKLELDDIELVVFGSNEPKESQGFNFPTHYLGNLHDDISLVALYNACDLTVIPSLQENLSNVVMESLSCGTPVVGFCIGGNSDMIVHEKNGYLAKPFESDDMAKGIEWILNNPNYDELRKNAREKVLTEFDSGVVARKYMELYKTVLNH